MPKEHLAIRSFAAVPAAPQAEIVPGRAGRAIDTAPSVQERRLRGLHSDVALPDMLPWKVAVAYREKDMIGHDGESLIINRGFGESGTGVITSMSEDVTLMSDGRAVWIGRGPEVRPSWLGKPRYTISQGGTPSDTFVVVPAETTSYSDRPGEWTFTATAGTTVEYGVFSHGTYFYAISLTYDDVQESPLYHGSDWYFYVDADDSSQYAEDYEIQIIVPASSHDNERWSALNLYRAVAPGIQGTAPDSAYEYVGTVKRPFKAAAPFVFTDKGAPGLSYQQRTDIPETLEHMALRWGLSAKIDNYHVVGRAKVGRFDGSGFTNEMRDTETWLFRSKAYRYDTFDWSALGDWLDLEFEPVALVPYRGRLWAFGRGTSAVVAVGTMTAEERLEGIGCLGPQSAIATDVGLFFCDEHNIYWHVGGEGTRTLADGIMTNEYSPERAWEAVDPDYAPVLLYSAREAMLVVYARFRVRAALPGGGFIEHSENGAIGYSLRDQDWREISLPDGDIIATGGFVTQDGKPLLARKGASGGDVTHVFGSRFVRRDWTWESPWVEQGGERYAYYTARVESNGHVYGFTEDDTDPDTPWTEVVQPATGSDQFEVFEHTPNNAPGDGSTPWGTVRAFRFRLKSLDGQDNRVRLVQHVRRAKGIR